jgi:hypothetical protein
MNFDMLRLLKKSEIFSILNLFIHYLRLWFLPIFYARDMTTCLVFSSVFYRLLLNWASQRILGTLFVFPLFLSISFLQRSIIILQSSTPNKLSNKRRYITYWDRTYSKDESTLSKSIQSPFHQTVSNVHTADSQYKRTTNTHRCSMMLQKQDCSKIIKFSGTSVQNSRDLHCTFRLSSSFTTCTITEEARHGNCSVKLPSLRVRSSGIPSITCDGVTVRSGILGYKKENKMSNIFFPQFLHQSKLAFIFDSYCSWMICRLLNVRRTSSYTTLPYNAHSCIDGARIHSTIQTIPSQQHKLQFIQTIIKRA